MASSDFLSLTLSSASTRGSTPSPGLIQCLPNQLQISLPSTIQLSDYEIAIDQVSLPKSWFNVAASYGSGSNSLSYVFGGTTYNVTWPDGMYSVSDLNAFMQQVMTQNGHFLVYTDPAGVQHNIYYLSLLSNLTYYTVTLTATPIPATLPTGYSNPNNIALSGTTPQLVLSPGTLAGILGFSAGTYPPAPSSTPYQTNGSSTGSPAPSDPVSAITFNCSIVQQSLYNTSPSSLLTIAPAAWTYGSVIQLRPQKAWYACATNSQPCSVIVITLLDQLGRNVPVNDTSILISLFLRRR